MLSPDIWGREGTWNLVLTINSYLKHYSYVTLYSSYSFYSPPNIQMPKREKFKWPKTLKIYWVNFFQSLVFVITKFMHLSRYNFFASFLAFRKRSMRGLGGLDGSVLNAACYLVLLCPRGCWLPYGWGAVRGPPCTGRAAKASKPVHQITKTTNRIENRLVRLV